MVQHHVKHNIARVGENHGDATNQSQHLDHHSAPSRGDGGMDFTPLCKQQGCTFVLCPPANDRWHPWPFFKRLVDAAQSLNTEYVTLMASTRRAGCFRSTHLPGFPGGFGPLEEANCVVLCSGGEWDD